MTAEEIKDQVTMYDLAQKYGISIRNNMCKCPFHGKDKHPSMKIFKDGFNCFACGKNGDIFTFVQEMEHCSFKEAFISLGGTYKKYENRTEKALIKSKFDSNKKRLAKSKNAEDDFRLLLSKSISKCNKIISESEPFSDEWCLANNSLPLLMNAWNEKEVEGKEVNEIDVIRICRKIGCI